MVNNKQDMLTPIIEWKQIYSNDDTIVPIFFFEPTLEILTLLRSNGGPSNRCWTFNILISGTNGLYDGISRGIIDQVVNHTGCLPDYADHPSPLYSISLPDVSFTLYPSKNGYFQIL